MHHIYFSVVGLNAVPAAEAETQYLFFLFPQHVNTWSPRHMNIGTLALSALDWSFISALPGWGRVLSGKSGNIYARGSFISSANLLTFQRSSWSRQTREVVALLITALISFGQGVMTATCTCFWAPRGAGCRPPWARSVFVQEFMSAILLICGAKMGKRRTGTASSGDMGVWLFF